MARVLVVQHGAAEPLGALEAPLVAAGHAIDARIAPAPLPSGLSDYGGLVVLGGAMGVYEADRFPSLRDEIRLLEEALRSALPTLGVCLGSQLLAAAGGARVFPGAAGPEVGWFPVTLRGADPWLAGWPPVFEPLHWHGDTFDLPEGAVLLASSERYPHQAFRLGSGLGLQFHVEATAALAREWLADPAMPMSWRPALSHLERCGSAAAAMAPLVLGLATAFAAAVGARADRR